ncbi:hypothetical protein [Cellulomonas sp.]|uniref:hypothetical protein n=1 Tax=Cellulomonas sp. TaxID=40001 RepID=UPI002811087F|nr:hypothetical protein [Cellulomonas sp.]
MSETDAGGTGSEGTGSGGTTGDELSDAGVGAGAGGEPNTMEPEEDPDAAPEVG